MQRLKSGFSAANRNCLIGGPGGTQVGTFIRWAWAGKHLEGGKEERGRSGAPPRRRSTETVSQGRTPKEGSEKEGKVRFVIHGNSG